MTEENKKQIIKIPVVCTKPCGESMDNVIKEMADEEHFEFIDCNSIYDVVNVLKKLDYAILLIHSPTKDYSLKHQAILKFFIKMILEKRVYVIVTTDFDDNDFTQAYDTLGCSDVLLEPVNEKKLTFKIKQYSNALIKMIGNESKRIEFKRKKETLKEESKIKINLKPPLNVENDFWVIKGGLLRKVGMRWLFELRGPGLLAGDWEEVNGENGMRKWKWVSTEKYKHIFGTKEGEWIFIGQKPLFRDQLWSFVGKSPELSFYINDENVGSKFMVKEDESVDLAKDSYIAIQKQDAFKETYEKVYHIQRSTRNEYEENVDIDEHIFRGNGDKSKVKNNKEWEIQKSSKVSKRVPFLENIYNQLNADSEEIPEGSVAAFRSIEECFDVDLEGTHYRPYKDHDQLRNPLYLSYIVSEFVALNELSIDDLLLHYSELVLDVYHDIKIELWLKLGDDNKCFFGDDKNKPKFLNVIKEQCAINDKEIYHFKDNRGGVVIPVISDEQELLGCIVLIGRDFTKESLASLEFFGYISQGVFKSVLIEQEKTAA